MGKTTRWFRSLLTGKKEVSSIPNAGDGKPHKTKRWSFVRSFRDKERSSPTPLPAQVNEQRGSYRERGAGRGTTSDAYLDAKVDPNKHAIAVAAATAAVAEAAVAAAQAAAAVVKLTSSGRCTAAYVSANGFRVEDCAAVKIQAAFRGYLARRALHALKGLVRLQALVRGHIVRKGTIETMRCMQALVRVQARARAGRAFIPESLPNKPSTSHNPGPATPEKYERTFRTNSTRHDRCSTLKRNSSRPNSRDGQELSRAHMTRNRLDRRMDEQWDYRQEPQIKTGPTDDEKSDKILEIDPGKPHLGTNGRNTIQQSQSFTTVDSPSKDSTTAQMSTPSLSSGEVQSVNRRVSHLVMEDETFSTAENSPQFYSASSRGGSVKRGPFTPTISDCSRSFLSGYSDYPSYMSNTESSKAKVRSQSAPKQRLEFEKSSSTKRYSLHGSGDARLAAQRASAALHANFTSKAYPGSGRLDRLGMPIRRETIGYSDMILERHIKECVMYPKESSWFAVVFYGPDQKYYDDLAFNPSPEHLVLGYTKK